MPQNPPRIAHLLCVFSPFSIQKYFKTNPPFQEAVTGHSLGALVYLKIKLSTAATPQ